MSTRHEEFNEKPKLAPAKSETPAPAPRPSSASALSEEIRPAATRVAVSDAERKAAEGSIAKLQAEYDDLAVKVPAAVGTPEHVKLLARKGAVTREIDALKRGAGIK